MKSKGRVSRSKNCLAQHRNIYSYMPYKVFHFVQ
jgi:hypothetical protein